MLEIVAKFLFRKVSNTNKRQIICFTSNDSFLSCALHILFLFDIIISLLCLTTVFCLSELSLQYNCV